MNATEVVGYVDQKGKHRRDDVFFMIMGAKRAGCSRSIRIEPVIVKLLQETVAEIPWIFVHGHLSDLKRSGRIPGIFCRGYHY